MVTIESAFKYKSMLINIVYKRVHNAETAEDIVQEVYIKVLKALNTFETLEHCKAWLIRCTINQTNTHMTSAYVKHTDLTKDISEYEEGLIFKIGKSTEDTSIEEEIALREQRHLVWDIINDLSDLYKEVIVEYYFNNKSIAEIAKIKGVPEGTVKSQLFRGRQQIERKLRFFKSVEGYNVYV